MATRGVRAASSSETPTCARRSWRPEGASWAPCCHVTLSERIRAKTNSGVCSCRVLISAKYCVLLISTVGTDSAL
eukprot:3151726-Prymnesium_polylepis.1